MTAKHAVWKSTLRTEQTSMVMVRAECLVWQAAWWLEVGQAGCRRASQCTTRVGVKRRARWESFRYGKSVAQTVNDSFIHGYGNATVVKRGRRSSLKQSRRVPFELHFVAVQETLFPSPPQEAWANRTPRVGKLHHSGHIKLAVAGLSLLRRLIAIHIIAAR